VGGEVLPKLWAEDRQLPLYRSIRSARAGFSAGIDPTLKGSQRRLDHLPAALLLLGGRLDPIRRGTKTLAHLD
jgi:hypothetical protein